MGAIERITVAVPTEMADVLRKSVEDGQYASEGEIIRDALNDWARTHRSNEAEVERLRRLVREADESGPPIPAEEVWDEIDALITSLENRG